MTLSPELVERVQRALDDQQARFADEPVMLRPDDVRGLLALAEATHLEEVVRLREALVCALAKLGCVRLDEVRR